jgi:hypothetical protein
MKLVFKAGGLFEDGSKSHKVGQLAMTKPTLLTDMTVRNDSALHYLWRWAKVSVNN